ncbi:hypothetical protein AN219_18650 [Streptomyces nanshensis]|nr:hypothetical protein AN219_18650 [Streptomyces nanshensis]
MSARHTGSRAQRVSTADGVLEDLRDALHVAGIALPSLSVHHSTWSSSEDSPGLVELGACPLDTARQLTAALRKASP